MTRNETKEIEMKAQDTKIKKHEVKETDMETKLQELEKDLNYKNDEFLKQVKRNEIIEKVLNKKTDELKNIEKRENKSKNYHLSCNMCDFRGKNKAALGKRKKSKHGEQKSEKITSTNDAINIIENDSNDDEFDSKVNGFLQAVKLLL